MARKPKKTDVEDWKRFDHFKTENEQLRKEVTKLRKLVKESCIDSLNEKLKRQEKGLDPVKPLCEICGNEDLHGVDVLRADGAFFFTVCNSCGAKSSLKKKKEIKKVIKNEDSEQ
jgi:hypothetical protein